MYSDRISCISSVGPALIVCLFAIEVSGLAAAQVVANPEHEDASLAEHPLQDDAALHDVCFVDRRRGWAVGSHGAILRTDDGGVTWNHQQSGVDASLYGVDFVDETTGWIVGGKMLPEGVGSRAVVLHTRDGGETWTRLSALSPALRCVEFFDAKRGVAVGCGSESQPSGVFTTVDGGESWRPRGGGVQQVCLAADFNDLANGVALGAGGRGAQLLGGETHKFRLIDAAGRPLRDAVLTSSTNGWAVGDGGLVFHTVDLGRTWQTAENLPTAEIAAADLRAVAAVDQNLWIAGAPGSYVLHSPDSGSTWRRRPTGIRTPINRLHFTDASHGWAVGDLGVILATADGGRSWNVQRGRERHAAVLAIAATSQEVPTEVLAQLARDEGYRTAVHVASDPGLGVRQPNVYLIPRLEDAATNLGANSVSTAWRFPTPSSRLQLDVEASQLALERLNDGRAAEFMVADIVRQIRMWQPEVVIVPSPESAGDSPIAAIVGLAAVEAVAQAADPTHHIDIASRWNLAPWQAQRVFAALPPGVRGTHHIALGATTRRLKKPLVDLAAASRSLLGMPVQKSDATAEFQILAGAGGGQADDLAAGLSIPPGGPTRRVWMPTADADDALLERKLAEKRRNLRQLIHAQSNVSTSIGQIVRLTSDLEPDAATALLEELADQLRTEGRIASVADLLHLLVERYPEHDRSEAALKWLVQYYASAETAHAYATGGQSLEQSDVASESHEEQIGVGDASAPSEVRPASAALTENLSIDERLTRAIRFADFAAQSRPQLYSQPSFRYPWAAAQRQRGFTSAAERYLLTLERRDPNNPWQVCAATESWLREPKDQPPPKPIATCRAVGRRPHLDGRLDESVWQTSSPIRLRNANAREALGAVELRLAYDQQFLFLGVRCAKVSGVSYEADDRPRVYDGDVALHDHLRLFLDVDRDYSTWYELAVDCRGWTADRCWGDPSWNPRWYVAADQDAESWSIEAAIPWVQLTDKPPQPRHVWAAAVDRAAPPVGLQSWNGEPAEQPTPENFGIVIFE